MFLERIKTFFHNRTIRLLATHRYERLKTNPIPTFLVLVTFGYSIYLSIPYLPWASSRLEEFVIVLDLQRILKLNFLENKDYYRIPVLVLWFYLVISILLDLSQIWKRELETKFYITDDALFLKQGSSLRKLPFPPNKWTYKGGVVRELFGLCKLEFEYESQKIVSPYFFGRSHESLLARIKRS